MIEKEYIELKKHFKQLGRDYDLLMDKLAQKDLLIDEYKNYIEVIEEEKEVLEEDNRSVYGLKTQINLLEEEKVVYEDRIKNLKLACEDFKKAYQLIKEELEEAKNIIQGLKIDIIKKGTFINDIEYSNNIFISELEERDYKEEFIKAKIEEAVEGLKDLFDSI